MTSAVKIRLANRAYDGILPILRGQMAIAGFAFDITETEDVPGMFAGMFKGQYDVSEMSLGELIYYTSRGKADFVAIPVFPSRMFRHGFIFCRKDSGIKTAVRFERPKNRLSALGANRGDLDARHAGRLIWRVGEDSQWYVASMHHWDDHDPGATVQPRDGSVIRMIENSGKNTSERACHALFDGQVDALGVTESQLPMLLANSIVKRLFDNPREVEAQLFPQTRKFCRSCMCWRCRNIWSITIQIYRRSCFNFTLTPNAGRSAGAGRSRVWSKLGPIIISAKSRKYFKAIPGLMAWRRTAMCWRSFSPTAMPRGFRAETIAIEEIFHPSTLKLERVIYLVS